MRDKNLILGIVVWLLGFSVALNAIGTIAVIVNQRQIIGLLDTCLDNTSNAGYGESCPKGSGRTERYRGSGRRSL